MWDLIDRKITPESIASEEASLIVKYLGHCYKIGDEAYRTNPVAKQEIEKINKQIYVQ